MDCFSLIASHLRAYFAKTTPRDSYTKAKASELTSAENVDSSLATLRLLTKSAKASARKKPATKGKSSQE
jgi:hypothetical protein